MAFRLTEVKKTTRRRSDGRRYIHPALLDATEMAPRVSLALTYFQSRLGRRRCDVDPEALVRFFGDPKVARGLVACLNASYRWRTQDFDEVLEAKDITHLQSLGIATPSNLRLFLYDRVNSAGDGFLGAQREEQIRFFTRRLRLEEEKLDKLITLDAEENAVLVRIGPVPEPEAVVALYNYHTVDTLLRNSGAIEIDNVTLVGRDALDRSCAEQGIRLNWQGSTARLDNTPDLLGSYLRGGVRLARALYAAAAEDPSILAHGRAYVHVSGRPVVYLFTKETARALTANTGCVLHTSAWPELRASWREYRATASTHGWRLLPFPEPMITSAGLVLAPFACRRDEITVYLWTAFSETARKSISVLQGAQLPIVPIVSGAISTDDIPHVPRQDGPAALVAYLIERWGVGRIAIEEQALDSLLEAVEARGFIPEREAMDALGGLTSAELLTRMRVLDPSRAVYVSSLGVCSPSFALAMRKGLRRASRRRPAA